jgi:hypothetical protein
MKSLKIKEPMLMEKLCIMVSPAVYNVDSSSLSKINAMQITGSTFKHL